ncbi:hypothetical protein ACFQL7_11290 [Halocatena marina]|uniref:Metallo-beta-lactamase domain-containing protein n=1 Tax=Halocatena marina TaxID=2934937 RepID=A0ABD5YLZ0_9EURY
MADAGLLDNGHWEIHSLDVGQADATLHITERGELILIDADKTDVIEPLDEVLDGRTTSQQDGDRISLHLLVTHLHDDHVRGIGALYDNDYRIQSVTQPDDDRFQVRDPDTGEPKKGVAKDVRDEYVNNLEKHGIDTISQISAGESLSIDSDTDLRVLAPPDTEKSVDVTRASTGADVNLPRSDRTRTVRSTNLKGNSQCCSWVTSKTSQTITVKVGSFRNTIIPRMM